METGPDKGKTSLRRKNGALGSRITRHSDGGKGKTRAGAGVCWKCGASLEELDVISREAERELEGFTFPAVDFKLPEFKVPDFKFPDLDLSVALEPLPHYSGPVIAEVGAPGEVKCSRCRGAVRVAEAEGAGRYALHSAGAPVCVRCAGSLPGGAGVVRVFSGIIPK